MKKLLKGAAVAVVIMIVLIVINMICNMNGHELDSVSTGVVASVGAMLIYGGLDKNEKNKDNQEWKVYTFYSVKSIVKFPVLRRNDIS